MKFWAIIAIFLALVALNLPAAAQTKYTINGDSWLGFVNKEDFDAVTGYAVDGDTEAFKNAVATGVMMGTIIMFNDGETVYLEDAPFLSGEVQLRRQGETQKYWTNSEAIYKK